MTDIDINPTPFTLEEWKAAQDDYEGWQAETGYFVSDPPPDEILGPEAMGEFWAAGSAKWGLTDWLGSPGNADNAEWFLTHDGLAQGEGA